MDSLSSCHGQDRRNVQEKKRRRDGDGGRNGEEKKRRGDDVVVYSGVDHLEGVPLEQALAAEDAAVYSKKVTKRRNVGQELRFKFYEDIGVPKPEPGEGPEAGENVVDRPVLAHDAHAEEQERQEEQEEEDDGVKLQALKDTSEDAPSRAEASGNQPQQAPVALPPAAAAAAAPVAPAAGPFAVDPYTGVPLAVINAFKRAPTPTSVCPAPGCSHVCTSGKAINSSQHWNRNHNPNSAYQKYSKDRVAGGIVCGIGGCAFRAEYYKVMEGHRCRKHKGARPGGYEKRFRNEQGGEGQGEDGEDLDAEGEDDDEVKQEE